MLLVSLSTVISHVLCVQWQLNSPEEQDGIKYPSRELGDGIISSTQMYFNKSLCDW